MILITFHTRLAEIWQAEIRQQKQLPLTGLTEMCQVEITQTETVQNEARLIARNKVGLSGNN